MTNEDIVIVACDSVDALTESIDPTLTNNDQWIFRLPYSFTTLGEKLLSKIPKNLLVAVDKIFMSSIAHDSHAKEYTFNEEKINQKRRVKPSVAMNAMGVSSLPMFMAACPNANDMVDVGYACASGLRSLELASNLAAAGEVVLVATVETPTAPYFLYYFNSLGALATGSEYHGPFDKNRNGFAMADAAAYVIICNRQVANKNNWKIIASISALSSTTIPSLTAPSDQKKLTEFIKKVISKSNISIDAVSHWDAHATATPVGDNVEYAIFNEVMHSETMLVSSKGAIGHSMASSSMTELVHSIKNLSMGTVKSNSRLTTREVDDSRIIISDSTTDKKSFVKCSFGFGGRNSAAVITIE